LATVLQIKNISKSFPGIQALKDVSFDLQGGEVHALVGENGAGKSTLVKIITGALEADAGTLEIDGEVLYQNDPLLSRSLGIVAIYQQPALFPDLTVTENLAIGLEPPGLWRRIRWGRRRKRALQLLKRVDANISPEKEARLLTMPEQQLVEIARALGSKARILIMDEPTASLTDQEVQKLFQVIRELKSHGVGIIYISHRLAELSSIADRVTVLRDGAVVGTRAAREATSTDIVRMMVGRELSAVFPKQAATPGDVVLEARNLACRASGVRAVNFSVRAGEILGLAGLIGAGRTELAHILFGLTPPSSGEIRIRGRPVDVSSPERAVRLGIAYLPEDRRQHGIIAPFSVAANSSLAVLPDLAWHGFLSFRRERDLATKFVTQLGIKTPSVFTAVEELSGGNQQKVALSRWLAATPSLLILDEPTQGVDVGAKAEIHRLMCDLAGRGLAILMISSELPEILGMSDRIAVMRRGTVAGMLERSEATQEKIMSLSLE
jgi:rhamnose transport system ATP-binding protein